MTRAAVDIMIPITDTADMILMTLFDFLEKRYRLAMKNDEFINL